MLHLNISPQPINDYKCIYMEIHDDNSSDPNDPQCTKMEIHEDPWDSSALHRSSKGQQAWHRGRSGRMSKASGTSPDVVATSWALGAVEDPPKAGLWMGKSLENHGKTIEQLENQGKPIGKWWEIAMYSGFAGENHRKNAGKLREKWKIVKP